jgi:hypothetical protein
MRHETLNTPIIRSLGLRNSGLATYASVAFRRPRRGNFVGGGAPCYFRRRRRRADPLLSAAAAASVQLRRAGVRRRRGLITSYKSIGELVYITFKLDMKYCHFTFLNYKKVCRRTYQLLIFYLNYYKEDDI